jgi:hypothetical protein
MPTARVALTLTLTPTLAAATTLLLLSCHSSPTPQATTSAPVTNACAVLTPSEISSALGVPIEPGVPIPKSSTLMCGWAKTGVTADSILVLNFTTPEYFEKERQPLPRITMTPAPGIADDAYYITSEFGTSLFLKKGSRVIGFSIRDRSIPSAAVMQKERELALKAAQRL